MSPVDRVQPRFPGPHFATASFVKISMCSYEKTDWPANRNLGFSNRDIGNRTGNALQGRWLNGTQPLTTCLNIAAIKQISLRDGKPDVRLFAWLKPSNRTSPVDRLIWKGPLISEQACTDPKLCDWLVSESNRIIFSRNDVVHVSLIISNWLWSRLLSFLSKPTIRPAFFIYHVISFRAKYPILFANNPVIVLLPIGVGRPVP